MIDFIPPWHLRPVLCDLSFTQFQKQKVPKIEFCSISSAREYHAAELFSDASKSSSTVSCATRGPNFNAGRTMNVNTRIFRVEVHGIFLVLSHAHVHDLSQNRGTT